MIQRTAILPIVTLVLLALGNIFHVQIPNDLGGQVTDAIVAVALAAHGIYAGILKNHKQDPPINPHQ